MTHGPLLSGKILGEWKKTGFRRDIPSAWQSFLWRTLAVWKPWVLSFVDIRDLWGSCLNSLSLSLLRRTVCPCIHLIVPLVSIYWECTMYHPHGTYYDKPWECDYINNPCFWGTYALLGNGEYTSSYRGVVKTIGGCQGSTYRCELGEKTRFII